MFKMLKVILLGKVQTYYRKKVFYCIYKANVCGVDKKPERADRWTLKATRYFSKQCDVALRIIETGL